MAALAKVVDKAGEEKKMGDPLFGEQGRKPPDSTGEEKKMGDPLFGEQGAKALKLPHELYPWQVGNRL